MKSERSLCRRLRLSPRGSPSFREMDGDRRLPTQVGQSGPDTPFPNNLAKIKLRGKPEEFQIKPPSSLRTQVKQFFSQCLGTLLKETMFWKWKLEMPGKTQSEKQENTDLAASPCWPRNNYGLELASTSSPWGLFAASD